LLEAVICFVVEEEEGESISILILHLQLEGTLKSIADYAYVLHLMKLLPCKTNHKLRKSQQSLLRELLPKAFHQYNMQKHENQSGKMFAKTQQEISHTSGQREEKEKQKQREKTLLKQESEMNDLEERKPKE
jgi:hypothetical protein